MQKVIFSLIIAIYGIQCYAQNAKAVQFPEIVKANTRTEIIIPEILGYKILKCDFHIHTVFSDGQVWPTVRVEEAWHDGLDAIAITDHIEYLPHKKYINGDFNTSYEIALPKANEMGIILVKAGEITRSMPPGHLNALFIDNVNILDKPDAMDAIKAAKAAGAFIQWNHPGWKAQQPDSARWMDYHQKLYDAGLMHGIEVFNEQEWYPVALDWCMEKGFAPMANSDIHGVTAYLYSSTHTRPMTLVLATKHSHEALKEGLLAGRTIAYFANKLAGKKEYLEAIFHKSIQVSPLKIANNEDQFQISNNSDIPFTINGDINFELPAHKSIAVKYKKGKAKVKVTNLFTSGNKCLETELVFK